MSMKYLRFFFILHWKMFSDTIPLIPILNLNQLFTIVSGGFRLDDTVDENLMRRPYYIVRHTHYPQMKPVVTQRIMKWTKLVMITAETLHYSKCISWGGIIHTAKNGIYYTYLTATTVKHYKWTTTGCRD